MTDDQRRDRDVRAWIIGEGSVRAPDRLQDAVRAEIGQTRQERSSSTVPEWLAAMPMRAAAAFVALAVGVGALGLLAGRTSIGLGPTATPTSTPAASTSASPLASPSMPAPTPEGNVLQAGPFKTATLRPAMQLVVPGGWTRSVDQSDYLVLVRPDAGWLRQADGAVYFDSVSVYVRPAAGQPDGTKLPVDGVGTSAKDLATWLSKRPQLTSTVPVRDTFAGVPAYRLDFQLSPKAGDLCGMPCANLLNSTDSADGYAMGLEGPWKVRAWLVDAPDGSTVMASIESPDGTGFDQTVAAGMPVIASMRFSAP